MKVHFGSGNDSAEDYYYITLGDASVHGLGLGGEGGGIGSVPGLGSQLVNGGGMAFFNSGIISFAIIPAGTQLLSVHMNDNNVNDTIELFTRNGNHLAGTTMSGGYGDWSRGGVANVADMNNKVLTEANAFLSSVSYNVDTLNGVGGDVNFTSGIAGNQFSYNGMNIGYSGNGNTGLLPGSDHDEYLTIDNVTQDLILLVVGGGIFSLKLLGALCPSLPQPEPMNP
jgi:flagellin